MTDETPGRDSNGDVPADDRDAESEHDVESLLEAIEDANDLLSEALHDANVYAGHDEVRPSAIRGFDRVQEAHDRLGDVDPTRGGEQS